MSNPAADLLDSVADFLCSYDRESTAELVRIVAAEHTRMAKQLKRLNAKLERCKKLLPDPRRMRGWDDPNCPVDVAATLIKHAKLLGFSVPKHLLTICSKE